MKHLEGQGEFPVSVRRLAANRSVPVFFALRSDQPNAHSMSDGWTTRWVGGCVDGRVNERMAGGWIDRGCTDE